MVSAEEGVCCAAIQQHAFVKKRQIVQRAGAAVAGNDAHLELSIEYPALDGRERAHMQAESHVRCGLAEQRNRAGNLGLRVTCRFVEHRHLQFAAHALVDIVHTRPECVGGGKQLRGLRVNVRAFWRQRKARPAPAA